MMSRRHTCVSPTLGSVAMLLIAATIPAAFAAEPTAPHSQPRLFALPAAPATSSSAPVSGASAAAAPAAPAPLPEAGGNLPAAVAAVKRIGAVAPSLGAMLPLPEGGSVPVLVGRSQIIKLPQPAQRIAVSDPRVADYVLVAPTQLYIFGKAPGTTTLLVWNKDDDLRKVDLVVDVDLSELRRTYAELLPGERDIKVKLIGGSLVLSGSVSDIIAAEHAVNFADAFARSLQRNLAGNASTEAEAGAPSMPSSSGQIRIINTLRIRDPQQVMLEVRFAEVARTALKSLGVAFDAKVGSGDFSWGIASSSVLLATAGTPLAALFFRDSGVSANASKDQRMVKILAEPTIVAVSGEEGSFLAGGRLLLPAAQASAAGGAPLFSFQERDFGVGLKFRPTVLDGGRISLRVSPEVTELDTNRLAFNNSGVPNNAPSFRIRRLSTTVQMKEGQSLIIGGLLQDNFKDGVKRVTGLGDLPVLGALFRSTDFSSERTELLVVVTPRLVRATDEVPMLPTEPVATPSEKQLFGQGTLEGGVAQ